MTRCLLTLLLQEFQQKLKNAIANKHAAADHLTNRDSNQLLVELCHELYKIISHHELDTGGDLSEAAKKSISAMSSSSQSSSNGMKGMTEAKIQYVRQMVFQHLSCKDQEVKVNIEAALMAIFRFSEEEKSQIDRKKKDETSDTLSSITSFLGSLTIEELLL